MTRACVCWPCRRASGHPRAQTHKNLFRPPARPTACGDTLSLALSLYAFACVSVSMVLSLSDPSYFKPSGCVVPTYFPFWRSFSFSAQLSAPHSTRKTASLSWPRIKKRCALCDIPTTIFPSAFFSRTTPTFFAFISPVLRCSSSFLFSSRAPWPSVHYAVVMLLFLILSAAPCLFILFHLPVCSSRALNRPRTLPRAYTQWTTLLLASDPFIL